MNRDKVINGIAKLSTSSGYRIRNEIRDCDSRSNYKQKLDELSCNAYSYRILYAVTNLVKSWDKRIFREYD